MASTALTKSEIAAILDEEYDCGRRGQMMRVLDAIADLAADELSEGRDFRLPGFVSIRWNYSPAVKKGERWKKGETRVNPFTKEEIVADKDSPPKPAAVNLRVGLVGEANKVKPKKGDPNFLKTATGKAVVRMKKSA